MLSVNDLITWHIHRCPPGVVSDMMVCFKTVGYVDSTVLRLLPILVSVGLKVIEKYWGNDVMRNQALGMILAMVRDRSSSLLKDLLIDLNGVSVISRQAFAIDFAGFQRAF